MPDAVLQWGIAVVLALQGVGDWAVAPMNLFTFTGNAEFYLLIMPALYWCYDSRLGTRVAIAAILSIALNVTLKIIIHDPRPYWFDPRVKLWSLPETSFGIPSGHSQNAVVLWGLLALHFRKWWAWTIAVTVIFLIGLSRVYLGVHFPTDVLAGWLVGIVFLVLFLRLEGPVTNWVTQWSQWPQIAIVFAASVAIIVAGALLSSVSSTIEIPNEWLQNAVAVSPEAPLTPLSIKDIVVSAAVFFGFTTGIILLAPYGGFDAGGWWVKRVARYVVGFIGVYVLWQGLGIVFALIVPEETFLGFVLRFIRYGLIGAWMSALGPLVFIWLGLATRKGGTIKAEEPVLSLPKE